MGSDEIKNQTNEETEREAIKDPKSEQTQQGEIVTADDLTEEEKEFLFAYREQTDNQLMVQQILGVDDESFASDESDPDNGRMHFCALDPNNIRDCRAFYLMMIDYIRESDQHQNRNTPLTTIQRVTESMLRMQGDADRHLELFKKGKEAVGFFYGKIDRSFHRGVVRPGWGYVMEFYVKTQYRRLGYGRAMYERLEQLLKDDGACKMYLTVDPVTGPPFWKAMGFQTTGEMSLENNLEFYEKELISFPPKKPSKRSE